MPLLITDRPPGGTSTLVQGFTEYFVDAEGRAWYRHRGQKLWHSRSETLEGLLERLPKWEERFRLQHYSELHPDEKGTHIFGPIDLTGRPPFREGDHGISFGDSPSFGRYLKVDRTRVGQRRAGFYFRGMDRDIWAYSPEKRAWAFYDEAFGGFLEFFDLHGARRRSQLLVPPNCAQTWHSLFGLTYESYDESLRFVTFESEPAGYYLPVNLPSNRRGDPYRVKAERWEAILARHFVPGYLAKTRQAMLRDNEVGLHFWDLPENDADLPQTPRYKVYYLDHFKCYQDRHGLWHWAQDVPVPHRVAKDHAVWNDGGTNSKQLHWHLTQLAAKRKENVRPVEELGEEDCPPYQVCEHTAGVFFRDDFGEIWEWYEQNGWWTRSALTLADYQEAVAEERPWVRPVPAKPSPPSHKVDAPSSPPATQPNDEKTDESRLSGAVTVEADDPPSPSSEPEVEPETPAPVPPPPVPPTKKPALDLTRFSRLTLPDDEPAN